MERLPIGGEELERWALNGASCWEQYSNGGCSLCYNADIAARVCTPSELKRKHSGTYEPTAAKRGLTCKPAHCIRLATVSAPSAAPTVCIARGCSNMLVLDATQWAALWYVGV